MIALIGFTGTGKSTIGRLLATSYGFICFDVDALVEQQVGCTVRELFATKGEATFRQLESDVIHHVINTCTARQAVLVTGAGAVLSKDNREYLDRHCFTVHIDTPLELVMARLATDQQRPLLQGADRAQAIDRTQVIESLYQARKDLYTFAHEKICATEARLAVTSILAKRMRKEGKR